MTWRQRRARLAVGALLGALVAGVAAPAAAYVRYTLKGKDVKFAWKQTCVPITSYPNDMLPMMTLDEINGATHGSVNAWSAAGESCTYLDIQLNESTEPTPLAAYDYHNILVFRVDTWCKLNPDSSCDTSMPEAYDSLALALTSVIASKTTGEIWDVDIEVNAHNFDWADLVAHPELATDSDHQDLQNALTHEVGHLIGLDHTCYMTGSNLPRPVDNNGDPLINCSNATPEVRETTMFPSAEPGDIEKRTLAPDDLLALCETYPKAADPMKCEPLRPPNQTGCDCAIAAASDGAPATVLALAALAVGARRRRRSRARG